MRGGERKCVPVTLIGKIARCPQERHFQLRGSGSLERIELDKRHGNARDHGPFPGCGGMRGTSLVPTRSQTRVSRASARVGTSMIPSPLTSIFPAIVGGAEATSSPLPFDPTKTWSSATRSAFSPSSPESARNLKARSDFPAPDGPRRRAARLPSATHVPCTSSRAPATVYAAGRRITKRAPPLFLSPPSPLPRPSPAAGRFSAHSRPPCATTICREMLSPSPEF